MNALTVGSLFSGIGGIDLGLERAGMSVAWQCEKDGPARRVMAHHWPNVPCYDDVKEIHAAGRCVRNDIRLAGVGREGHVMAGEIPPVDSASDRAGRDVAGKQDAGGLLRAATPDERRGRTDDDPPCPYCVPSVDVLCGGFPCQDLSIAGRRAGLAGLRSGLFHEFARLASELAPTWLVIENVPGLLSSNDGADMGIVLGVLADLGYGWAYRVLDAQYFGVAQRRERVFIVGCSRGAAGASAVLFDAESCAGNPPPRRAPGQEVAPTLEAGANATGGTRPPGTTVDTADTLVPEVAHSLRAQSQLAHREDQDTLVVGPLLPDVAHTVTTREGQGAERGDGTENLVPVAFMWQAGGKKDPSGAFIQYDLTPTLPKSQTIAVAFMENQRGETWEAPVVQALTSTGGGKPGQGYPAIRQAMTVRRLTPLECERLQGFPELHTATDGAGEYVHKGKAWRCVKGTPDGRRYTQLGNAVCVPVAEWIGRRIMEAAV